MASPHYLASAAGLSVLASGGNALDAAVATNLTLGAVVPYLCGYGGDLFALIWHDGGPHGYIGAGRSPAAATPDAVRAAAEADTMPGAGPLTVTVPGAVEAWFTLLERFGSRSFAELAQPAIRYARDGFVLTAKGAEIVEASKAMYTRPWAQAWERTYGKANALEPLRQPDLARTIETIATEGPDAYYRGEIAEAIAATLQEHGALMAADDLAAHRGDWVTPLRTTYHGVEVLELPPPTQGVAALEALNIAEELDLGGPDTVERHHLLLEAIKLALADRDAHVTDPDHMRVDPAALASKTLARERHTLIDPARAGDPGPGRPGAGGTIYLCAADADGMCVSLIQSNYVGFGSGVTVPGWGINLQNRGAYFSLDPGHVNVIAPGKRTMHTLVPALALRDGAPWLVFGTMGGDGQAQTHLQLLTRIVDDGEDVQRAVSAPRWMVTPGTWEVAAEPRFDRDLLDGLRHLGHRLRTVRDFDSTMGHAHAIEITPHGYAGATDPRAEGAVLGL